MMSSESGGILAASAMTPAGNGMLPREFRPGFLGRFDRRFSLLLGICGVVVFTTIGILSLRKPAADISDKEIMKIQERYARLVLNQPEAKIEAPAKEAPITKTEKAIPEKKEEEKPEEVKIDREKETFAEKQVRKETGVEQRRQIREQNVRQIQNAGIFAALTSTGGTGSGSSTTDLLGTAGLGVSNLGDLALTKGTFATKNVDAADLVARKGERSASTDINRETIGKTTVTTVASAAQVNVTTQAPEVTGESSSLQERSHSAIQTVVSRETRRLKRLYEEWLKRDPTLSGRLEIKFVILASGTVSNVTILKSTTGNAEFDEMVVRYIKRWQFSPVEGSGPVEVVYPFVFEGQS